VVYEKKCENKNKAKMKCHGKCQMMMKMQEEEKKEQQCPAGCKTELKTAVLFSKSFFSAINHPLRIETSNPNQLIYTTGKSVDRSLDIFHPPQV